MNPVFQVRPWTPEDHPVIVNWRKVHGVEPMPANIVPPLAVVTERNGEPVAFGACFQTETRPGALPVAYLEWITTRPGLSMREAREAVGHVIECLKAMAQSTGPAIMLTYCGPALSREAVKLGFSYDKQPMRMHFMLLNDRTKEVLP